MAICAANMRECDKKAKCAFGPNEGQAYNPKSPCCGQGEFDEDTCDCILECSKYWLATISSAGTVAEIGCTGSCSLTPGGSFLTQLIELPFAAGRFTSTFSHRSISEFCETGPVNCGRTPASYGVDSLYAYDGSDYPLGPGDTMSCGNVDTLFAVFRECNVEFPRTVGVMVQTYGGGASACMVDLFSLVSIEPQDPP